MLKKQGNNCKKVYIFAVTKIKGVFTLFLRTSRHPSCILESVSVSNFSVATMPLEPSLFNLFPLIFFPVYLLLFPSVSLCYFFHMLKTGNANLAHIYLLPSPSSSLLKFSWKAVHQCS